MPRVKIHDTGLVRLVEEERPLLLPVEPPAELVKLYSIAPHVSANSVESFVEVRAMDYIKITLTGGREVYGHHVPLPNPRPDDPPAYFVVDFEASLPATVLVAPTLAELLDKYQRRIARDIDAAERRMTQEAARIAARQRHLSTVARAAELAREAVNVS